MVKCIWQGTLYTALVALYVAGLAAVMAFLTWGFADPNEMSLWYGLLRVGLVVWLFAVCMVCAGKRCGK